ncbi:MAG: porphobilinogen synthase [Bacteroidia bacterium]|jgi:porphobilinogen synthase
MRETIVTCDDLIYPLFIMDGDGAAQAISSLPGVHRFGLSGILNEIDVCMKLGIRTFVLFPAVEDSLKDKTATYGLDASNFYLQAAREIKSRFPECCLMSDVAMDPYSSDGHDGLVKDGKILNDETLEILGEMAVQQADAGFDILGPSDMMDGRVAWIREELDENDFTETAIMSYSAKYASAFYGPFRDALESAPKSGDKKTYQMDPANKREALLEAELDEDEGADWLMVKPATLYLDIIQSIKDNAGVPVSAYNVSGEYAMVKAASANGWIDHDPAMVEMLTSIKRAGADAILTYFAKEFAELQSKR